MRLCKVFSLFLITGLLWNTAVAGDVKAVLRLTDIQAKKTIEQNGDDVYFNITQYSSLGHSSEKRIPIYPAHWLSKQLSDVKHLSLWDGVLMEGESIKLVITLSEQDLHPWDTDHLIGAITLTLQNKKGKLHSKWNIPVFEEKDEVEMVQNGATKRYVFKGERSRYDVAFEVGH